METLVAFSVCASSDNQMLLFSTHHLHPTFWPNMQDVHCTSASLLQVSFVAYPFL